MGTITKEQLRERARQKVKSLELAATQTAFADPRAELEEELELARIALASLEAEAVGEVVLGEYDDCGCHPDARVECIAADGQAEWENFKDGTRLYTAPPAPVVADERAGFNAWNNEDNLPIAGVGAKNAAWLAWQARATLCGNAVLDVPPKRPADSSSGDDVEVWFDEGWNACRAAMLAAAPAPGKEG